MRCNTARVKTSQLTATELSQNDCEIHRFFLHDYTPFLDVSMLESIYDKHVTITAKNIAKYLYFLLLYENYFSHQ